jgi:hypothetical protein
MYSINYSKNSLLYPFAVNSVSELKFTTFKSLISNIGCFDIFITLWKL